MNYFIPPSSITDIAETSPNSPSCAKPQRSALPSPNAWGEGERYDVIVRVDNVFARVQVKSVLAKAPGKSYYRVGTTANHSTRYSANDIDFLVAYIFPRIPGTSSRSPSSSNEKLSA